MKLRSYIFIAVAMLMLPVLTACRHELCYDHYPALDFSFEWEQEWERDYGAYHMEGWDTDLYGNTYDALRPWLPEWLMVVKYLDSGQTDERFISMAGGQMITGSDVRSMLLYNGDTEYIILSDMASVQDARASTTTRSRSSIASIMSKYPDARTTNPPDVLYSAFIEDFPRVANHERYPLHVKMQPLVYTYVITYEFEKGLEHVAYARGALGGMAESVYLRDGRTSDRPTIILFDCMVRPFGCQSFVRSFGVPGFPDKYYGRQSPEANPQEYNLNLEVMLKNGKTIEFNFDITDQIARQPRGGVIKVSGLRIEDEESNFNSGFDVNVDDWGNHNYIDLTVGVEK